jgi:hypothetical protein
LFHLPSPSLSLYTNGVVNYSYLVRYPPKDAEDFANKYIVGKFTYVSNLEQIRGRTIDRAGGDKELEAVLEELTPLEVYRHNLCILHLTLHIYIHIYIFRPSLAYINKYLHHILLFYKLI